MRDCAAAPHDAPGADLAPLGRRLLLLQVLRFLLVSLTLGIPALLPLSLIHI